MAKEQIINADAHENHCEGQCRIQAYLHNETTKSQLMDFLGIDKKFAGEYTHETLVVKVMQEALVGTNIKWEDILDNFEIDNVRVCTLCGEPMVVGVYADGDYYCSDECLDKGLGINKYLELSKDTDKDPDCEYYLTQWD